MCELKNKSQDLLIDIKNNIYQLKQENIKLLSKIKEKQVVIKEKELLVEQLKKLLTNIDEFS